MCGRLSLRTTGGKIVEGLDVVIPAIERFAISPYATSEHGEGVIVRLGDDGKLFASIAKWGFLPANIRDTKWRQHIARAEGKSGEGIENMRMYGNAFRNQRCLVITDGFFEWQEAKPYKQPYFVPRKDGKAFALAGIWARRTDENGEPEENFAVISVAPNEQLKDIHKRMPMILDKDHYLSWLDPAADLETLKALCRPYPNPILAAYKVSTKVNNPNADDPDCIKPK